MDIRIVRTRNEQAKRKTEKRIQQAFWNHLMNSLNWKPKSQASTTDIIRRNGLLVKLKQQHNVQEHRNNEKQ